MAGTMEIEVERTVVKSEPELRELINGDPLLASSEVQVRMAAKGFGTKVTITARGADLAEADLEKLLDELAEPRKRPFKGP